MRVKKYTSDVGSIFGCVAKMKKIERSDMISILNSEEKRIFAAS